MKDEGASQGFTIENLKLKGFMRYLSPQKIDFKEKFTVITGRTGSGKTSLLDAITFALYGQTSRTDMQAVKLSDICAKSGYVSLSFTQKNDRYDVERGLDNKGLSYLTLWKNGSKVLGKITELTKIIEDIVGLDYTGFKNSTFVRQEEMKELGSVTPPVRLGIFQKLFRLETFEKAQEVVKKKLDDLKLEIREKESAVNVRREDLAKIPVLEKELEILNKELDVEGERLEIVIKELTEKEKQLDVLEKSHDEYTMLKVKIEGLEKELEILYKRLSEKKSELEEFEKSKNAVEKLETEIKAREKFRKEWDALREKEHESSKLLREEELYKQRFKELEVEYEENKSELNRELDREESRIAQLSTDIGEKEAFSILKREGALTERIDRIEKELKWLSRKKDIVAKLKDEKVKARKELWEVEGKSARINKDSFILTEIDDNIKRIKTKIKKEEKIHKEKKSNLEKELKEVNKKLKKIGFSKEDETKLVELKDKIGELEEDKKELDVARKRLNELGDVSTVINDLSTRRDETEKNLKELAETESKSRSSEDGYRSVKETVRAMMDNKDEINKILYAKKGQVEQLKKRIFELEELKVAVKKDERELDALRDNKEVYTILKDDVFHNRGIVMYAINQIMPQLSIEASNNLSALSAGRFSKVKLEAKEEGARYGIGILVEGFDGAWHDVYEFSGGEKTQINAALRFSIAKELACLPQVGRTYGRMRTLFIDEGDLGSLDTETSRGLFVKKLFDMGEFFDKVILITHLSDVADTFPGKVRIEMTSENESRIHLENWEDRA